MSELTVTIRDANSALHAHIHASHTVYLVAALSADPETIPELQAALARYLPDEAERFFRLWHKGTDAESWDAGVCVIDLAARLVALRSTYSAPGTSGDVDVKGHDGRDDSIRYHLADDWLITSETDGWGALARSRRAAREANPPFDARPVLYDRVCEYIAAACAAEPSAEDTDGADRIRAIHAIWLTAPRADLRGHAPRDVLLRRRGHLGRDLQDRCEQWTAQLAAPPGLSKDSAAYRFAGFGTHEIVLYYDLVRVLLSDCWGQVHSASAPSDRALAAEADRLRRVRDEWLRSANAADMCGKSPAEIIERERLRLPEGVTDADAVIDPDCPLCQMTADSVEPTFWHLDGCNMDDDFAFSFDLTREEWDAEQRRREEHDRAFNARYAAETQEADSPWLTSYTNPDAPPAFAAFGLASLLAELVQSLKHAGAARHTIDDLNRYFGNVRAVSQDADTSLVEPAIERLCEALAAAAADHPPLAAPCADFERRVREFGDRASARSDEDGPQ